MTSRKKSKDTLKQMKMRTQQSKIYDTVKAVLGGEFVELQAYHKKQEKSQKGNLTLHLNKL